MPGPDETIETSLARGSGSDPEPGKSSGRHAAGRQPEIGGGWCVQCVPLELDRTAFEDRPLEGPL